MSWHGVVFTLAGDYCDLGWRQYYGVFQVGYQSLSMGDKHLPLLCCTVCEKLQLVGFYKSLFCEYVRES